MSGTVTPTAAVIGIALIAAGLLGFIDNPLVGEPSNGDAPLFVTGLPHDIVHLLTGALALFIAFGMRGSTQAWALVGFGVLYAGVLVLTLVDGDLFGILDHPVNALDHVLHLALAVIALGVGWMALQNRSVRA